MDCWLHLVQHLNTASNRSSYTSQVSNTYSHSFNAPLIWSVVSSLCAEIGSYDGSRAHQSNQPTTNMISPVTTKTMMTKRKKKKRQLKNDYLLSKKYRRVSRTQLDIWRHLVKVLGSECDWHELQIEWYINRFSFSQYIQFLRPRAELACSILITFSLFGAAFYSNSYSIDSVGLYQILETFDTSTFCSEQRSIGSPIACAGRWTNGKFNIFIFSIRWFLPRPLSHESTYFDSCR